MKKILILLFVLALTANIYCQETQTNCSNGIDDDGDGLIDCLDPSCDRALGPDGGTCEPDGEWSCLDSYDNDGDHQVDCADPDCQIFSYCDDETRSLCNDNIDNDGNGYIDCLDIGCDRYIGPGGVQCEWNEEWSCNDLHDNDGDYQIDCADPDCQIFSYCDDEIESLCNDNIDNDGDGLKDCDDTGCYTNDLCKDDGNCRYGEKSAIDCSKELYCNDNVDNDNDGNMDCYDQDCKNILPCSTSFTCTDGNCTLTLIDATQQGQTIGRSSPIFEWLKNWKLLTVIFLILSLVIVVLTGIAGKSTENPQLTAWSNQEMGQVIVSLIIFMALLITLFSIDVIADQIVNNVFGDQYKFDDNVSKTFAIGTYYVNDLLNVAQNKAVEVAKDNLEVGKEITTRIGINYQDWPYLAVSRSPGAGEKMRYLRNNYIIETYGNLMSVLSVQKALLEGIAVVIGPVLIMLGIILRSFIFTRKAGGTLLAAGIGLLIVYPLTYSLALYSMSISVQGNKMINPVSVNCPSECLIEVPIAFNGSMIFNTTKDLMPMTPAGHFADDDPSKNYMKTNYGVNFCEDECTNCDPECRTLPISNCGCNISNSPGSCSNCPQECMITQTMTACENDKTQHLEEYCPESACPDYCKTNLSNTLDIDNYLNCEDVPWHCRYNGIGWDMTNDPACINVPLNNCQATYILPNKNIIDMDCNRLCDDPAYCRILNPSEDLPDECTDTNCPSKCKTDFNTGWHQTCEDDDWDDCPDFCRFVEEADRAPQCFEESVFRECELMPDYCKLETAKNTPCASCFQCEEDCRYIEEPTRTNCQEVCNVDLSQGVMSMSMDNVLDDMSEQGADGESDTKFAGILMIPAFILPLFNIVLTLAFIRGLSKYIGGDYDIPGIAKII